MKPFDLDRAKAGAKLVTRDGRKARLVAHVPECADEHRVIAHIAGDIMSSDYSEAGKVWEGFESTDDLFLAADDRTIYANVFPGGHADWFDTEAEARAGLNARALKIAVPVTYEV